MNVGIFIRLFLCILMIGVFLYAYVNKQNQITELRLQIPVAAGQLRVVQQENTGLQFEIDQFENPLRLMELARLPQFSHLKHPLVNEIITIQVPREEP
ncbi:MAG: hypothetical protein S4CHLAM2_14200 [Chlamydiales bacterium]|nr:hypothetical protein [Chlamydiales bacterium]